jgi:aspartate-semialdehyde dehydrogenase
MFKVAIVGATGAVGAELLRVLEARNFPVRELVALASPRSAGQQLPFAGGMVTVAPATPEAFADCDFVFFSAGASRSRELAPAALAAGAHVIDNSSAFRTDPAIPLVVPEVNPDAIGPDHRLVANPNCVAAIMSVACAPLARVVPLRRLVVATYQSASGAGALAMEDLEVQTRDYLAGRPIIAKVLPHPYAFNLFSHNAAIEDNGYNGEENKVVFEMKKIMQQPDLLLSVTCVRVPVLRAHSMALNIETTAADVAPLIPAMQAALAQAPGVRVVDDRDRNHFPMPNEASGADPVLVGRLRADPSHPGAVNLFIVGDQLLKGAALNAVQLAELIAPRRRA